MDRRIREELVKGSPLFQGAASMIGQLAKVFDVLVSPTKDIRSRRLGWFNLPPATARRLGDKEP